MYFVMEQKLLTVNNDLYTPTASLLTNGGRGIYRTVPVLAIKRNTNLCLEGVGDWNATHTVECPDTHYFF